jgi:hypothetical protein
MRCVDEDEGADMTDDRTLLERAAKAAGIAGEWDEAYRGFVTERDLNGMAAVLWMPLADDATAFRLAVKLRVSVEFGEDGDSGPTFMAGYFIENGNRLQYAIEHETQAQDATAATRRAIVRAAAMAPTGEKP